LPQSKERTLEVEQNKLPATLLRGLATSLLRTVTVICSLDLPYITNHFTQITNQSADGNYFVQLLWPLLKWPMGLPCTQLTWFYVPDLLVKSAEETSSSLGQIPALRLGSSREPQKAGTSSLFTQRD